MGTGTLPAAPATGKVGEQMCKQPFREADFHVLPAEKRVLPVASAAARQSSCASVYTTAAEMLARWCAKNELGISHVTPVCPPCGE